MTSEHLSEDTLSSWALDELAEAERPATAAHLEECAECRTAAAALRATLVAYREVEREPPPRALLADLLTAQAAGASAASTGSGPTFRPMRVALAAAAIVLLFLSGFWVGRESTANIEPARALPGDRPVDAVPAAGAGAGTAEGIPSPLPDPPVVRFAAIPAIGT